jgi:hypothetical protein
VSALFPPGIERLDDMPHTLFRAINRAVAILSWEELDEKERPPKAIWTDDEALVEHFQRIKRNREREREGQGIEDPVDNDFAKELRGA